MCDNNYADVASIFVDTFSSSFTVEPSPIVLPKILTGKVSNSICEVAFTPALVNTLIKKLKDSLAPGLDKLSAKILKTCSEFLRARF